MFIEFTIGNFKSFHDKITFSMVAANLTSENEELDSDNVIPVKKDLSLLKTSAIYGANASGKSNFGVALRFMRDFVLNSSRETFADAEIAVEPFLLDRKTLNEPSFFEIVFLLDGTQYRYGFEVDKSHVVSEWLFRAKARETTLFTREENDIQVKAAFKEGQGLQARTRPNTLFLSVLAQFDGDAANQIRRWFGTLEIETGLQDENMRGYTLQCLRNPKQKNDIVAFLKTLDLDIDDVQASEPPPIEAVLSSLPSEEVQQIVDRLRKIIYTVHRFGEGKKDIALFDLDQHESQGTRKLVALAGPLSSILANGQTIFIDELDARLHPLVTRRIIEMFHSPQTNPHDAQLIFTTHDTNLLDKALFRRDQVWFAEKDRQGATHLISLAEYKPRNDAAYEKQYLMGRYGGVPFLGGMTVLAQQFIS